MEMNIDRALLREYVEGQKEAKLSHYASGLQALKDLTDLGNADSNVSKDYAGRFAFELMQNGADAYQKGVKRDPDRWPAGQGEVCFTLARGYMVVANTGVPFSQYPDPGDREDISSLESLGRLGESTKKSGEYIGNKGVGIRSIYQICNRLWLISGGYNIRYDGGNTWEELERRLVNSSLRDKESCLEYLNRHKGRIPMLKVGFWFEKGEFPDEMAAIVENLQGQGYDTILVLERTGSADSETSNSFAWERLSSLSEKEILFLDTLSEVHCNNQDDLEKSFSYCLERDGNIRRISRKPDGKKWEFLTFQSDIPDMGQKAQIAFEMEGDCLRPAVGGRVFYSFYPAIREEHGFPFHIHSYFMLNPNREYFGSETEQEIERNRELLGRLAQELRKVIVPALRERYSNAFLPALLLPQLNQSLRERLVELGENDEPSREFLARKSGAAAWFVREVLRSLKDQGLVHDTSSVFVPLSEIKLPPEDDPVAISSADHLFRALKGYPQARSLPGGLSCENEALLKSMTEVRDFISCQALDLDVLTAALEVVGSFFKPESQEAGALLYLFEKLKETSGDGSEALRKAIERIRQARVPVLPCSGPNNYQPLPPYPEKGKPMRASPESPLVFYMPPQAEKETVDDTVEEEDSEILAEELQLPGFCHVHVLKSEVLNNVPGVDADRMRAILRESFGLRPFKPEDIFVRIAESTLGVSKESQFLTPLQRRDFFEVTLELIERRRLRAAARNAKYDFQPWYLKDRESSDWRLYYFLARSYIPVSGEWLPGSSIILAGRLSEAGEHVKPAYDGTGQVFLTEHSEDPYLVGLLNRKYDEMTRPTEQPEGQLQDADLAQRRLAFRRYIYRLMGAWDGLRFEIIHHPDGFRSDGSAPALNPHTAIGDDVWEAYIENSWSPWQAYGLKENCHLVQSAALPHVISLAAATGSRDAFAASLKTSLSLIKKFAWVELRSPNNTRGEIPSLLLRQLQEFPWASRNMRDEAIPEDAGLWFTRQNIPPRTHDRQSAHYLLSVTASQMDERLAQALEIPVLEEPDPTTLEDFTKLYEELCERLEKEPAPGPGFITLYRSVVARIQQILLGKEKQSDEGISSALEKYHAVLERIREAGVIVSHASKASYGLERDLGSIYYDDTGAQSPIFQRLLAMATFDDTSQGISRLLGIKLLSQADIRYDDGSSPGFSGFEDIEEELERMLNDMRAPLFAFRAFASFIPDAQRLTVGEELYNKRYEVFKDLKVEIAHRLRISIEGGQYQDVPIEFPVVLEHESQPGSRRRLFIRKNSLSGDTHVPLRILARPLAAVLGAEAQTIAVEMLLTQYEQGLSAAYEYLESQCGVTLAHIKEIEDLDIEIRAEQERLVQELEDKLFKVISSGFPKLVVEEGVKKELHDLLILERSLQSSVVRDFLRDRLGIPLHEVSAGLGLKPIAANLDRFTAQKNLSRKRVLIELAKKRDINESGPVWDDLLANYNSIVLPEELKYNLYPEEVLRRPIAAFAEENGVECFEELPPELDKEDEERWEALTVGANLDDARKETNLAVVRLFVPWIVALVKKSTTLSVPDLLDALSEVGLDNTSIEDDTLDGLLLKFQKYLRRYPVQDAWVTRILENWPGLTPMTTELPLEYVEGVRMEIERWRIRQKSNSQRQVQMYRKHLDDVLAHNTAVTLPKRIEFKTEQAKEVVVAEGAAVAAKSPGIPRKIKYHPVLEEDYLAADFRKRVVGECAEHFALEVQKMRWKKLGTDEPDTALSLLKEVIGHYDLGEEVGEEGATFMWDSWERLPPSSWADPANWPALRTVLHMAKWSPSAGYDLLGLDREQETDEWSVFRIEVKATGGKSKLEFPISRNELDEAERNGRSYVIWRVLNVSNGHEPSFFRLPDPAKLIQEGRITTVDQVTILKPGIRLV